MLNFLCCKFTFVRYIRVYKVNICYTYDHFEVLTKDSEGFKVKQNIVVTQDDESGMGNNYDYDQIYIAEFVKEDGKWEFAGFEK